MTFEDLSQQGAQAGSSTRRVQGIFGLPRHAEGDGGLFSPRLGEMVTTDAGTCLLLASQLFKHTAVTWKRGDRGDRDQIPPAATQKPTAPAQHPLPPIKPWRAATPGGLNTHRKGLRQALPPCTHVVTALHPGCDQAAENNIPRTQTPTFGFSIHISRVRIPSPLQSAWLLRDVVAQVASS